MNYDDNFRENPLKVSRYYPFALGNGPPGYQAIVEPDPKDKDGISHKNRLKPGTNGDEFPLGGLTVYDWGQESLKGVWQVSLDLVVDRTTGAIDPMTARHVLQLSYIDDDSPVNGFTCYFLPWDQTGGAVYMTLGADADYFFTAALSGCSIMVSGNADAPTVFHCGVGGWDGQPYTRPDIKYANEKPNKSEELWVDLVKYLLRDRQPYTLLGINTTHYTNDRTEGMPNTTPESRAIEIKLRKKKKDQKAMAAPWGAVFGLRDQNTGDWSFYLQKNVTLTYQRKGQLNCKVRPLVVHQFCPFYQNLARKWSKL